MCWLYVVVGLPTSSVPQGQTPHWVLISRQWWAPQVKVGSHHRGREQWGGPRSSAPTLNYWVGLAVATCFTITTLPAKAHRPTSQSPIALSSKAHMNLMYLLGGGSFTLRWRGMTYRQRTERERTETCHVDNFLTIPLKASGMNLQSGLKPLKLI